MDFTLNKYKDLLQFLRDNYEICTVEEYLSKRPNNNFVILRHDVDRSPKNALKMAEVERELGVRSTYYFRYPYTFKPDIIKRINKLGHEVGYHYETLSKAKGNYKNAIHLFETELKEFRKLVDVKTICMHGNPLSNFDNRELWKKHDFRDYGILGEAYLSIDDPEIYYLTDTGRNWENRNNMRDRYLWRNLSKRIKNTEQLIQRLSKITPFKLYITTHPERWGYNTVNWMIGYFRDFIFNTGKKIFNKI